MMSSVLASQSCTSGTLQPLGCTNLSQVVLYLASSMHSHMVGYNCINGFTSLGLLNLYFLHLRLVIQLGRVFQGHGFIHHESPEKRRHGIKMDGMHVKRLLSNFHLGRFSLETKAFCAVLNFPHIPFSPLCLPIQFSISSFQFLLFLHFSVCNIYAYLRMGLSSCLCQTTGSCRPKSFLQ